MGVVNVESCGNRDSHILCMDEPYVVKTTCGLLVFSWLILCWNLRHEILPKELLRSFSLGVFPIFTKPLFFCEACMASAQLEMERFVV